MMKKYISVAAAILLQLCLGGIYAWSAFVPSLQQVYGLTSGQTQVVFGFTICFFVLFMIPAGRTLDRRGPRLLVLVSALLLYAGYTVAGLFGANYGVLLFAYTMLVAPAMSCGYVSAIGTGIKWFPKHKGLISGLTVAGYGGGAIVLSAIAEALLAHGWDVLAIFRVLGIAYGSVVLLCSLLIFSPGISHHDDISPISIPALFRRREFWGLAAGILCGTFPGVVIIGNLKPIGMDMGLTALVAAAGIGVLSFGNALGRIVWGRVNDRYNEKRVAQVLFLAVAASVVLLPLFGGSRMGFQIAAFFLGAGYGGCLSLYPAQTAAMFGHGNFGKVYPLVITAHGLAAAVGASLGGFLRDLTGTFSLSFVMAFMVAALGLCLYTWLYPSGSQTGHIRQHSRC